MFKKNLLLTLAVAISSLTLSGCATMISTGKVEEQEKIFQAKQAELESKMNAKGTIVYAVKNIPEGTVFKVDQLAEREIEQSKIPVDAITSASIVVGRKAKYDVASGQIVSQHDIALSKPLKKE